MLNLTDHKIFFLLETFVLSKVFCVKRTSALKFPRIARLSRVCLACTIAHYNLAKVTSTKARVQTKEFSRKLLPSPETYRVPAYIYTHAQDIK